MGREYTNNMTNYHPPHPAVRVLDAADMPYRPSAISRPRMQSFPADHEEHMLERFRSLHISDNTTVTSEDGRSNTTTAVEDERPGGLKSFLKRASSTLKARAVRPRRHSHSTAAFSDQDASEYRPSTSSTSTWHRLRQATSFKHAKLSTSGFESAIGLHHSPDEIMAPIPGRNGPPTIPEFGGAAARATAALQNEYFSRSQFLFNVEDGQNDGESGVGIAVTTGSPFVLSPPTEATISKIDFIKELPAELAIQILGHLDYQGLSAASLVSHEWYRTVQSNHIWRESFYRERTGTYATGAPIVPGSGLGIPAPGPKSDFKAMYKAHQRLDQAWATGKAQSVWLNGHLDSIYCVQFDESKIITGSRDKTIRIWDMHTYACTLVIGPPDVIHDPTLMTSDDGTPTHYAILNDQSQLIHPPPRTISYPLYHNASILCLQYDDTILVTGSSDGTAIVYSIADNYRPIRRLVHHSAAVLDLSFDDHYITTCSKDATVCIWDRATGVMLRQLKGHQGPVNAIQMRGNTIVSCSGDFRVKLWNVDSGKNIREFPGHTKGLACSQFSDDSRLIASAGNDRLIRIWDANTGECLKKITAHQDLVRSLHIDSVSGRLVSGSYDRDIKVFDMETGRSLLEFPKWHGSWVLSAKSDYRRIVSTGQEPKILIIDFGGGVEGVEMLESV